MAHTGFSMYFFEDGNILTLNTYRSRVRKVRSTYEEYLEYLLEEMDEEDVFYDYKINKAIGENHDN